MMNFNLMTFHLICLWLISVAINSEVESESINNSIQLKENNAHKSFFTGVDYFLVHLTPVFHLNAKTLTMNDYSHIISFAQPLGKAFSPDNRVFNYHGQRGEIHQLKNSLSLQGEVKIWDQTSQLFADKIFYEMPKDYLRGEGQVKSNTLVLKTGDQIKINSKKIESWPKKQLTHYSGDVYGNLIRKKIYEPGVIFQSKVLNIKLSESLIELIDNVYLQRAKMDARSGRGEIYLENYNKKLKYYTLYDDVRIVEKFETFDGKQVMRRAFAEKLLGYVFSGKLVLHGYPRVIQDNDVIKGNKITLIENREVIEIEDSSSNFIMK